MKLSFILKTDNHMCIKRNVATRKTFLKGEKKKLKTKILKNKNT